MAEEFGTRREWLRYHIGWNFHVAFCLPVLIFAKYLEDGANYVSDRVVDWAERA